MDNNCKKVLLVGPIETKGRYAGGIAYIVNALTSCKKLFLEQEIEIAPVDSCCVRRKACAAGRMNFDNLVNSFVLIRLIRKKINQEKPDLVYFNTSRKYALLKDLLILWLVGRRDNVKTILHIHFADVNELFPPQKILKKLCGKLLLFNVDHLVLLSERTKMDLIADGYNPRKMSVLYNFHTLTFTQEEIEEKQNAYLNKDKKDIVFIGSLDRRKGIVDLLSAFQCCAPYARLHICGQFTDGDIEAEVKAQLKRLPQNAVIMHGFVNAEEKRSILKNCEIMVLPSYGEGFPIVLVEGLAAGCEIIATDVGAIPEVFSEKTGRLIPAGNVDILGEELLRGVQSRDRTDIMINNWKLSQEFTLNHFIEKMCDICKEVANG